MSLNWLEFITDCRSFKISWIWWLVIKVIMFYLYLWRTVWFLLKVLKFENDRYYKYPMANCSEHHCNFFLQTSSTYFVGEVKNTCVWWKLEVWTRNRNRWEIGESINQVVNKSSWDRINWFNNAAEGHCVYQITGNARKSRAYRIVLVVTLLDAIFVIHELTMALSVQQISLAGQIGTFAIR